MTPGEEEVLSVRGKGKRERRKRGKVQRTVQMEIFAGKKEGERKEGSR